jgi:quercetin dioxygenase-like cupin family protein
MRAHNGLAIAVVVLSLAAVLGQATQRSSEPSVIISTDGQAARPQAGPYNGGGTTTVYGYFDNGEAKALAFRKRALHPGSAIGSHAIAYDEEVYYIVSGRGRLVANGKTSVVSAGTAILLQRGAVVSLQPEGSEDRVMFIAFPREPQK